MKTRFWPLIAAVAVLGGLYALFAAGGGQATAPAGKAEPPVRPDVPAITLPRADGGTFSTAALRGKSPVVVSFFATWCGPCREELPHLVDLYRKYHAAGLQVVSITNEDAATARQFAKEQAIPFPILIDADAAVATRFGADALPTTVVLDKHGRAADASQGYSEDRFDQTVTLVEKLLKE